MDSDQTDTDSELGRESDVVNEATPLSAPPISRSVPIKVKVVDTESFVEGMRPYTMYVIMTTRKDGGKIVVVGEGISIILWCCIDLQCETNTGAG